MEEDQVVETEEQEKDGEDRGALEGMTDLQIQRMLMFKPLAEKVRLARFLQDARKPFRKPQPKPKKPAPKHRAALLKKKAEAQGWGEEVK